MDAKLQDRQLKYVLKKYIIPNKGFDPTEIRTQEELNDVQEGLKKYHNLSEDEHMELSLSIRNGTYEL
ncbi:MULTISPECIES: hypothetical protein [Bacillus cereus group]|uniref:hypothetical protein n=1 Tax=Bacillus cereus group TaxID=86661 RepID=UPI000BEC85E6|nr:MULTISPECIES: hypothetical protein [Bacillus cereus group]MBG9713146.1 hypothetical protein [Bacillus cereus]MDR4971609.1 hypothetical protein [Bacillus toyonensis]PEC29053.1 hypothetical protein CON75_04290 [Bacillus thuringiensis]PFZ20020.1 hypothetical protein COL73_15770 [Bacillus thuringiensis]PHD99134.1 hypothetical protein COF43_15525 [Bacillus toyonensis]